MDCQAILNAVNRLSKFGPYVWLKKSTDGHGLLISQSIKGRVAISLPVEVPSCCVDAPLLAGLMRRMPEAGFEINAQPSTVSIQCDGMRFTIPNRNLPVPEVPDRLADPEVRLNRNEVVEAMGRLSAVKHQAETVYADAIRMFTEDGLLHLCTSTSTCWASSSVEANVAGNIDAMVPSSSMSQLSRILSGDECLVQVRGHGVQIDSGDASVLLGTAGTGRRPRKFSEMQPVWEGALKWSVSRDSLLFFLEQASFLCGSESTGVWLKPVEGGVQGVYASQAIDALGGCNVYIPGKAEGGPVYVSCKALQPAVAALEKDDEALLLVTEGGITVASDQFVMGVAQLAQSTVGELV